MQLYVVRHTKVNIPSGLCYGHFEVPLAPDYLQGFEQIKQQLPNNFDQIYTSPSLRCEKLAQYIQNDFQRKEALRELHFGDWEGQNWADIPFEESKSWMEDFVQVAPPNGESLCEMFLRINRFIDQLRQENHEHVLLVTHAGVIRCLMAYFLEFPLNSLFKIQVGYGAIYRFNLADKRSMDQVMI